MLGNISAGQVNWGIPPRASMEEWKYGRLEVLNHKLSAQA